MWKDFFYFTRAERQGILVFVAGWLIPVKENTAKNDTEKFKKEYAGFMSSIREKEQKIYSHNNRFQPPRTVRLTTFDPNITDSVGFLDLGLPAWMAKNILRYRSKGGKFRKAEDFKKVYEFSKSVGLPTKLKDLEFDSSQLEEIAKIAVEMKDIDHNPYKITKEMVEESIRKLEAI